MSESAKLLIVPIVLTTGSLRFAEVQEAAVAQDVINSLAAVEEVRTEMIGDLEDHGWALQSIRAERNGRPWEEDELEALGDGQFVFFETSNLL
jgi:diaphanous 1